MIMNRVNLDAFNSTIDQAKKDRKKAKLTISMEDEWLINGTGAQCSAKLPTEKGGDFLVESDEPLFLGGGGTVPNPAQYWIYGMTACLAAAYAKTAALEGIKLNSFKIKVAVDLDLSASLGIAPDPIITGIRWDLVVDSKAGKDALERVLDIAKGRCPAFYAITHPTSPKATVAKI
jgi:uncharacterized OsmC-like protein